MADKPQKRWIKHIFCLPLAVILLISIEILESTKPILNPIHKIYKSRKAHYQQSRRAAAKAKQTLRNAPKSLPPYRPRSLSTLPQTPQSASKLLTHLPLEIRQEIYTYVLGGNLIHILRKGTHLAHVRCKKTKNENENDFQRLCRPNARNTAHSESPTLASTSNGNLALLRTCRTVYREAVDILYATNAFDFDHQDLFILFARSVLPARLEKIRCLHFSGREIHFRSTFLNLGSEVKSVGLAGGCGWELMCKVIANGMPGLKGLSVRICGEQGLEFPDRERWWVESMCRIRGLESFELEFRAPSNCWVGLGEGVFEMERLLEGFIRGAVCSEALT
ncbi:MAG: hypothetical protein Q9221_000843 [Calogaya cf. arnoldii]